MFVVIQTPSFHWHNYWSFICFVYSFTHFSFTYSLVHSFIRLVTRLFTPSFVYVINHLISTYFHHCLRVFFCCNWSDLIDIISYSFRCCFQMSFVVVVLIFLPICLSIFNVQKLKNLFSSILYLPLHTHIYKSVGQLP